LYLLGRHIRGRLQVRLSYFLKHSKAHEARLDYAEVDVPKSI
jgi:hypothetical protein